MAAVEAQLRGHVWPILALVATLSIAANGGRVGSNRVMDAHFDPKRMPVEAVNYLEKHEVNGPVLSPDYWGGYLIYRLYPKTRVVVDDRHDLYGEQFFQVLFEDDASGAGWEEFLDSMRLPAYCCQGRRRWRTFCSKRRAGNDLRRRCGDRVCARRPGKPLTEGI